ncbi:F-box protein [Acorus calamus]|uniref:F-box protein n=1 Tax=Acorus calamus TaxID=4465 RepID=A0AAV9E0D3_ACOCL|nr:F-box protein [Acorus calamus]
MEFTRRIEVNTLPLETNCCWELAQEGYPEYVRVPRKLNRLPHPLAPFHQRGLGSDGEKKGLLLMEGEEVEAAWSRVKSRYHHVRQINLEFAQDVEDIHLILLKNKYTDSLKELQSLNLNGCRKISDEGIKAITSACPTLRVFSIYWNVRKERRATDSLPGSPYIVHRFGVVKHGKLGEEGARPFEILEWINPKWMMQTQLRKKATRKATTTLTEEQNSYHSLHVIADNYQQLEMLNLTRCVKLTDSGLRQILLKCSSLQSLNLYALSSFTDNAYKEISSLTNLRFLDLCGAPCSLFGIVGVTDKCLEALSKTCSQTLTTLDVIGCIGIKKRSQDQLRQLFPYLSLAERLTRDRRRRVTRRTTRKAEMAVTMEMEIYLTKMQL